MTILGISAYYHDSSATLIRDGKIVASVQEERFSRKKHDASFPTSSILHCLKEAQIGIEEVDYIAFYEKPFIKFERLLETYLTEAPRGFLSFSRAIPIWLKEKLYIKRTLVRELEKIYSKANSNIDKSQIKNFREAITKKLRFGEHHQSHASSAFFPSPFEESAILVIDGVGEWATTSLAYGEGNSIKILSEIRFPHSLGLLYSAFTYYLGFRVNSGEYKVMGLAPYGEPLYVDIIRDKLIDIKADGSFHLNMDYFNYTIGLTMVNSKFHQLFNSPPREKESEIEQFHMDIASSLQVVTEEVIVKLAKHARRVTNSKNLVLAGGVALNCVANSKILRGELFENIWVQPASGDAGGSLGVALALYYQELKNGRVVSQTDSMEGAYLGFEESEEEIESYLNSLDVKYHKFSDEVQLLDVVSDEIANGKVVGWHMGKMEFGPRALGHRSILGDPRDENMQSKMNLKIKYRESFRPFAPSVLREHVSEWFDLDIDSPYMLFTANIKSDKLCDIEPKDFKVRSMQEILKVRRSLVPAVTHIDGSARLQTVTEERNGRYYRLIAQFYKKTGSPMVINTSFNVRGEPIVCSAEDSYRCFMRTEMDILVLENMILYKGEQPKRDGYLDWQEEFELD